MEENNNTNPYASPTIDQAAKAVPGRSRSMFNQIRIVAICMIIQGILELLFAAYMIAMSFIYPMILEQVPNQQIPANEAEMLDTVQYYSVMYFAIVGGLIFLVGAMRLCAGILNFQYRARTLGIITNFLGIASIATCYCLPTGIAICVYGSIIYFNPDVAQAFQMKANGHKDSEILEFFNR